SEALTCRLLEARDISFDLHAQTVRVLPVTEKRNGFRARDRKTGRHRYAEIRHLREVGAFPAEHALHFARAFGRTVPEKENRLRHGLSSHSQSGASADRSVEASGSHPRNKRDKTRRGHRELTRASRSAKDSPGNQRRAFCRFHLLRDSQR